MVSEGSIVVRTSPSAAQRLQTVLLMKHHWEFQKFQWSVEHNFSQHSDLNHRPCVTGVDDFVLCLHCLSKSPVQQSQTCVHDHRVLLNASDPLIQNHPNLYTSFGVMAKRFSAVQPNGEILVLEVTPETTGRLLKQQIKDGQCWDELTRRTTSVEIIVGDSQLLADDAKVLDAGIAEDSALTVVFKQNKVICSDQHAIASLGGIVDSQLFLAVEIPHGEIQILQDAFAGCYKLANLTVPDTVTHIGERAFRWCTSLAELDHPKLSDLYWGFCLFGLQCFGKLFHPELSD